MNGLGFGAPLKSWWVTGWGCSGEDGGVRGCSRERKRENLSYCCSANGTPGRRRMCLIRKWGETEGHTYLGTAGEGTRRVAYRHEAERRCIRLARGVRSAAALEASYGLNDDTASLAAGRCRRFALEEDKRVDGNGQVRSRLCEASQAKWRNPRGGGPGCCTTGG